MIDAFRRLTHIQPSSRASEEASSKSKPLGNSISSSGKGAENSQQAAQLEGSEPASTAPRERLQCPPDTFQLGRSTWTFLHTMAAYYPEEPTRAQKSLMRSMMEGLAEFYPCSVCADHLREQVGGLKQEGSPVYPVCCNAWGWVCTILCLCSSSCAVSRVLCGLNDCPALSAMKQWALCCNGFMPPCRSKAQRTSLH